MFNTLPLTTLPNKHNYHFTGIGHDDTEYDCKILFDGKNYRAYKIDPFGPCFSMLKGWKRK
jgi:hypothetical protein